MNLQDHLKNRALVKCKNNEKWIERLNIEFKEIEKGGLWNYFCQLILNKKKYKNTNNLLCAFLWGICDENPMDSNKELIWEESNEFPDLDIDFAPEYRETIKDFCIENFGSEKVVSIANYNHFGIKSGIRDIARVLEIPLEDVAFTTQLDDDINNMSWEEALINYPILNEFQNKYPEACKLVNEFNGRVRSLGKHAGGLVISSVDISKTIPLITRKDPKTKKTFILSSFAEGQNHSDLKPVGLVKLDILGLTNLNYISTCIKFMEQRGKYNKDTGLFRLGSELDDWSDESYLNDVKCLNNANKGDLKLVFQFDSPGIRELVRNGGVSSFEDLCAYTSLYRPGPLDSGMASKYILRKNGKEEYRTHNILDPIIGNTYYVIIFQEQLMNIMNKVGLISLQDCDNIRRAMSKKKEKEFLVYKDQFINNGQNVLKWTKNEIEELWNQMVTFANYGFNRSHAVGYSFTSARCLYLKTFYPIEYWAAVLSHLKTGDPRIQLYIREGIRKGLKFRPVDINDSKLGFTITDNDEIIIGFNKLKGIEKEAPNLIKLQPFKSFNDYLERYGYGKTVTETLIKSGAFNKFDNNMKLLSNYFEFYRERVKDTKGMNKTEFGKMYKELLGAKSCPRIMTNEFGEKISKNQTKVPYNELIELANNNQFDFSGIEKSKIINYIKDHYELFNNNITSLEEYKKNILVKNVCDFSFKEKSKFEYEIYSFYFNHPLDNYQCEGLFINNLLSTKNPGTVEGFISNIVSKNTKNGNPYYIITLEDQFDKVDILLWGNQYSSYSNLIFVGSCVRIDIIPSKYHTWNLRKDGNIERIRSAQEPSLEEERKIISEREYRKMINEIINSQGEKYNYE